MLVSILNLSLSRVPQKRASGHRGASSVAMTEVATSLLALLSVGILRPMPSMPIAHGRPLPFVPTKLAAETTAGAS
jgi:hypothetical protein